MTSASFRRASLPFLLAGLASCGGDGPGTTEPDPPRAASMTISKSAVTLTFLNQVVNLQATVLDQFNKKFTATVSWSSADASVATVSPNGQVKAIKNGTTTVTAASGSLSASATVTVQQVATRAVVVSGDGQIGTVGETLPEPIVVRSVDQGGSPMAGASITFTPQGDGSVGSTQVTSDADALASTTWTLATTVRPAAGVAWGSPAPRRGRSSSRPRLPRDRPPPSRRSPATSRSRPWT